MTDLPWLRLYTDTVDNEKLRLLAFEDRWHYIALLCLKQQGVLDEEPELRDRMVAVKMGIQLRELDEVKRRLMEVNLVGHDLQPTGWSNHQFRSDSSTDRVRKYRENKEKSKCNVTETLLKRSCNAIDTDTDTDKTFGQFWFLYPKKVKKKTSMEIWKRKKLKSKVDILIADIKNRQANDKRWNSGYIPDPTTYLNQERWEDDIDPINNLKSNNYDPTDYAI